MWPSLDQQTEPPSDVPRARLPLFYFCVWILSMEESWPRGTHMSVELLLSTETRPCSASPEG